jgi:hypothetical protein
MSRQHRRLIKKTREKTVNTNIFTVLEMIQQKIPPEEISDENIKLMSYSIECFDFHNGPTHEDWAYWNKTRRALLDRFKVMEEQNPVRELLPKKLKLNGQLWENCECGNEPIYMSHGCCERCAKDQEN